MPLSRLLEPAIRYAEDGFPVSEVIAFQWENNLPKLRSYASGEELLVDGNAPRKGDRMRLPTLATTLRAIAEGGCEAFYHGPIAEKMASFVQEHGGWLTTEDLASHTSDWDEPITADYRGVTCWECPPNGQGIAALEALNIVEGFDIGAMGAQSADAYHHLIEAMRLAFVDAYRYVADPRMVDVPTEQLVSKEFAGPAAGVDGPPQGDGDGSLRSTPSGRQHGVRERRGRAGQRLLADQQHILRLRLRHGDARHRHRAAQPRRAVLAGRGSPKRLGAGQAALPHHHPRDGYERRRVAVLLRH